MLPSVGGSYFYQYPVGLWSIVLLKQICQNVGLLINRHFEEELKSLLVAYYHEFRNMCSFLLIGLTKYFLEVYFAERAECYATQCVCKIKSERYIA